MVEGEWLKLACGWVDECAREVLKDTVYLVYCSILPQTTLNYYSAGLRIKLPRMCLIYFCGSGKAPAHEQTSTISLLLSLLAAPVSRVCLYPRDVHEKECGVLELNKIQFLHRHWHDMAVQKYGISIAQQDADGGGGWKLFVCDTTSFVSSRRIA